MGRFIFDIPTRVLFVSGQLNRLYKQKLPGKKALIAISNGTSVRRYGYLSQLEGQLDKSGVSYELFDEIRPNPTMRYVMDGAAKAKAAGCNFVAALGGGSMMACGKCIALMMTNGDSLWDYSYSTASGKQKPVKVAAPIVCVTTSAGTGSEVDNGAVISNEVAQEKSGMAFPSLFPKLSIVDPKLMVSVPPKFTAYQGMDAFFHAAESVINTKQHPMGEMFALKTIELIAKNLPKAYENGMVLEARSNMALANSLAGYYMLCTSEPYHTHAMGSFHDDLVHGAGLNTLVYAYFDFFAGRKAAEGAMIKMAKAMGVQNPTSGKNFIKALDNLIEAVGCGGLKMSDAGITQEELKQYPPMIHQVLGGDITADSLPLSDADYLEIYEKAWK